MRTLAATGCAEAAELLEKADELDKALAKDPLGPNDGPRRMGSSTSPVVRYYEVTDLSLS